MLVTIKYNQPIGDFRAVERTEQFYADSMFEAEGTSLVYFRIGYNVKAVSKNEVVSITQKGGG